METSKRLESDLPSNNLNKRLTSYSMQQMYNKSNHKSNKTNLKSEQKNLHQNQSSQFKKNFPKQENSFCTEQDKLSRISDDDNRKNSKNTSNFNSVYKNSLNNKNIDSMNLKKKFTKIDAAKTSALYKKKFSKWKNNYSMINEISKKLADYFKFQNTYQDQQPWE